MFAKIDSSSRGYKKLNPSGINLVLEFITLVVSINFNQTRHNTCQSMNIEEGRHLSSKVKYMLSPQKAGPDFMNIWSLVQCTLNLASLV